MHPAPQSGNGLGLVKRPKPTAERKLEFFYVRSFGNQALSMYAAAETGEAMYAAAEIRSGKAASYFPSQRT